MIAASRLRSLLDRVCTQLPGAQKSDPWGGGHDAWKVGGKMFACIGSQGAGVSVKCTDIETAQMLIDAGAGQKAPYFHRSWVILTETASEDEIAHRTIVSYDIVRASLTKKAQSELPARQEMEA